MTGSSARKEPIDCAEQKRLNDAREAEIPWKKWGPYLSERQWGTVREDYSPNGDAWNFFTHDQSLRNQSVGRSWSVAVSGPRL